MARRTKAQIEADAEAAAVDASIEAEAEAEVKAEAAEAAEVVEAELIPIALVDETDDAEDAWPDRPSDDDFNAMLANGIAGLEVVDASETNEPNSIIIFGHPKRGKTTLAGSIVNVPGYERVLHIDLEKGSGAMARQFPNVKVIRPAKNDVDAVVAIINALEEDPWSLGFDCVILDTVSTFQKWLQFNWREKHGGKLEFDGWAYLGDTVMDLMWQMHNMYALGISTYHTKVEQNELTKQTWTVPFIQGSARNSVASVPDMVLYIDINPKGERVVQMVPKTAMMTGSRYEDVLSGNLTGRVEMPQIFGPIRDQ